MWQLGQFRCKFVWVLFYILGYSYVPVAAQSWRTVKMEDPGMLGAYAYAGAGTRIGGLAVVGDYAHPILWNANTGSWIDLYPHQDGGGSIYAMYGEFQGGVGGGGPGACIWHGTPESRIDLHPASNPWLSQVVDMDLTSQVGHTAQTVNSTLYRASLWHSTAASYIDLHPAGAVRSSATAVSGAWQGGWITRTTGGYRAAMWHGTASSIVDLNPVGVKESQILDMTADQQVGWAYPNNGGFFHAALWRGTAESWVDLAPPGPGFSKIEATCGSAQAGNAYNFAAVWFGTSQSYQSLQSYLPAGYGESTATSISFVNGLYYIGGYAYKDSGGIDAFVWIGVPTPGTAAAFTAAAALSVRRARR